MAVRGGGVRVSITGDSSGLQREAAKAERAVDAIDAHVKRLSGGTRQLTAAQRENLVEQAKSSAEAKRYQGALRTLGVEEQQVTRHIKGHNSALGAGRRHAEEAVAANVALTGSFKGMARSAATAGAGFLGAYVGISKAKDAVKSTEELAHATEILHRNTGLSVKSSSDWVATAHARGIQAGALNMSFTKLSQAFLKADVGQKASVQTLKALGLTQAQVHAGAQNFGTALATTADKLGAMKGGTDRLAIAQSVLGRGAKDLIPLFSDGAKGMQEQLDAAKKYGVELNAKTLPLLTKLTANQRETKLASLGLKVAFTEAVTPALLKVEGASLRLARIWADPRLTNEQKWHRIGKAVGGLWKTAKAEFDKDLPKIANQVGQDAPKVAMAFVHGFEKANIWGKLAIGAFLLRKMGGIGAVAAIGRRVGSTFSKGVAEGEVAGGGKGGGGAVAILTRVGIPVWLASQIAQKLLHNENADPLLFLHPPDAGDPRPGHGDVVAPNDQAGRDRHGILRAHPRGLFARGGKTQFEFDPTIGAGAVVPVTPAQGKAMRDFGLSAKHAAEYVRELNAGQKNAPMVKYVRDLKSGHAAVDDLAASTRKLRHEQSDAGQQVDHFGKVTVDLGGKQVAVSAKTQKLADQVGALRVHLSHLKVGSDAYNQTAAKLTVKQDQLSKTIAAGKPAADHARAGFGTLRTTAANLGATVHDVAVSIGDTTNKVLKGFGAHEIKLGLKAVGTGVNAVLKARGGYIGRPGEVGRDEVPLWEDPRAVILTRYQQEALGFDQGGKVPVIAARGEYRAPPEDVPQLEMLARARGYSGLDELFATVNRPHYMAKGGRPRGRRHAVGGYVFPLPDFGSEERVDRGQDMESRTPYANTVALGSGRVTSSTIGWPGMRLKLDSGPFAGHEVFYGHNNHTWARVGQHLRAGQKIGQVGNLSGGGDSRHTEIGFMEGYGSQSGHWIGPGSEGGMLMHMLLHQMAPSKIGLTPVGGYPRGWSAARLKRPINNLTVLPGGGGPESLKRLLVRGPDGPLKRIAQGASDKMRGAANSYLASKAPQSVPGGVPGGLGSATVSGNASVRKWAIALLKDLNIPPRPTAVNDLMRWAVAEGGHWHNSAHYNPLNTTYNLPGHVTNSFGVGIKGYDSWKSGLRATVATLRHYPSIVRALRSGSYGSFRSAVYGSSWGTTSGLARGGFVGKRMASGGYATAAGNPYLPPPAHHRRHRHAHTSKPPGTSRHWNPFTHRYALVTSATYTRWLHRWQAGHPTLPMPGGPTHKHHPTPTTDINPLTGHVETHLPAKWKKIRLKHREQAAAAARAIKHEDTRIGHITGGALGHLNESDTLIQGADEESQDYATDAAHEQHQYEANPPDLTTAAGQAAYGHHIVGQEVGLVGQIGSLTHERAIVLAKARRYKEAVRGLQKELKRKHLPAASRKKILGLIDRYRRAFRELKKQAHRLGIQIGDLGIDLETLQHSAPADELSGILGDIDLHEQAGDITPEQADAQRHAARQWALGGGFGQLTSHDALQIRGDDKQAQDNATTAVVDNTQAIKDLADAIKANTAQAAAVSSVGQREVTRLLGDMLSGYYGPKVTQRRSTPSAGSVARA